MFYQKFTSLIIVMLLISACGGTASLPTVTPTPDNLSGAPTEQVSAPVANQTSGCVEAYDPAIDYFPDKANPDYADGWTIDYFNNYKVITVLNPWHDAGTEFQYVLVQCGTPAPDGFVDAQVIEVPIDTIVTMSTTNLPHLTELDLLDTLVGVDSFPFISTPEVVALIEAGKLAEIGNGAEVNVERVIELDPDVVMTHGTGDLQNDAHPKLLEAGMTVVVNAEYMETSPLGRAEWIKFMAALFNHEAAAEAIFADIASEYADLAAQAATVSERPIVFTNAPFQGTWYMPGGESYVAQLLSDAGANYLWSDDDSTGSLQLSFELVYDRAADADFWVNTNTWASIDEALAADERFADFAALQNGGMYNNNARLNPNGGNDYWESGVTRPQIILADLVKIFHPELLPEHELYYYQQVR